MKHTVWPESVFIFLGRKEIWRKTVRNEQIFFSIIIPLLLQLAFPGLAGYLFEYFTNGINQLDK